MMKHDHVSDVSAAAASNVGLTANVRPTWDTTWLAIAEVMSFRSLCANAKIGAVIVSASQRLVSSGYNSPPAGFKVDSTALAHPSGIVEPTSVANCQYFCPRARGGVRTPGDYSNCISVHAELNALAYADRSSMEGGTLYVTGTVCWDCGKVVANSGITRVVMMSRGPDDDNRDPNRTVRMMIECGIHVEVRAL
jgi:dCMP deaminase